MTDKMEMAMSAVQDQLLAVMREHETQDHGGVENCWGSRCSAAAFLCHSLGIRTGKKEIWEHFLFHLRDYESDCDSGRHDHADDKGD